MKHALWLLLALAALFVFITNEAFIVADYPLYHGYRVHLFADRHVVLPHALFGTIALLAGPPQFSTIAISSGRALFPGTCVQAGAWTTCTLAAFLTARNRHIAQHRQWMVRSYAVTFTFVTLRILSIWPAFFNLSDAASVVIIIATTFASVLLCDLAMNWGELTSRRG